MPTDNKTQNSELKGQTGRAPAGDQRINNLAISQPEISRRCAACGASLRERAMFCPECGKPLPQVPEQPNVEVIATAPEKVVLDAAAESTAAPQPSTAASDIQEAAKIRTEPDKQAPDDSAKQLPAHATAISKSGKYEKARDSLHRASTATRDALADNVKRVEKIRHVSSAMLEEATYDPSLRFVLVALGLFIVFVILLVLSKVMG